jgi:hypothetical protein
MTHLGHERPIVQGCEAQFSPKQYAKICALNFTVRVRVCRRHERISGRMSGDEYPTAAKSLGLCHHPQALL